MSKEAIAYEHLIKDSDILDRFEKSVMTPEDYIVIKQALTQPTSKGLEVKCALNRIETLRGYKLTGRGIDALNYLENFIKQAPTVSDDDKKLRKWWLSQTIEWRTTVINEYNKQHNDRISQPNLDTLKQEIIGLATKEQLGINFDKASIILSDGYDTFCVSLFKKRLVMDEGLELEFKMWKLFIKYFELLEVQDE